MHDEANAVRAWLVTILETLTDDPTEKRDLIELHAEEIWLAAAQTNELFPSASERRKDREVSDKVSKAAQRLRHALSGITDNVRVEAGLEAGDGDAEAFLRFLPRLENLDGGFAPLGGRGGQTDKTALEIANEVIEACEAITGSLLTHGKHSDSPYPAGKAFEVCSMVFELLGKGGKHAKNPKTVDGVYWSPDYYLREAFKARKVKALYDSK